MSIKNKLKSTYDESKAYTDSIMDRISSVLTEEEIPYITKSKNTEIVVSECKMTKDELFSHIYTSLMVPKMVFYILVDMVESDDKIYIRLKTK